MTPQFARDLTYGVMGMLDFWRDPRVEEDAALPKPFEEGDAPFCPPLDDFAALARMSFRNWSLFMLIGQGSQTDPYLAMRT